MKIAVVEEKELNSLYSDPFGMVVYKNKSQLSVYRAV